MQIFPFWSPKILPLNLDMFLWAFRHFNELIVFDPRQQFMQHYSNFYREKINMISFTEVLCFLCLDAKFIESSFYIKFLGDITEPKETRRIE